jgi:hypothetical protein
MKGWKADTQIKDMTLGRTGALKMKTAAQVIMQKLQHGCFQAGQAGRQLRYMTAVPCTAAQHGSAHMLFLVSYWLGLLCPELASWYCGPTFSVGTSLQGSLQAVSAAASRSGSAQLRRHLRLLSCLGTLPLLAPCAVVLRRQLHHRLLCCIVHVALCLLNLQQQQQQCWCYKMRMCVPESQALLSSEQHGGIL